MESSQAAGTSAAAGTSEIANPPADIRQEALNDPVVQALEQLGGQVVDIEEL